MFYKAAIVNNNLISLVILVFLYTISYLFFNVIFFDGDDVFMALIASGGFTGEPDAHLVFINYSFGQLFKTLYTINSNVYWYSIIMIFLQFVSAFFILRYFIQFRNNKFGKFLFLYLIFFIWYLIIRVQFTSITFLLAFAGLLFLRDFLITRKYLHLYISLIFMIISINLRSNMFLVTFILGVSCLFSEIVYINLQKKIKTLIFFSMIIAVLYFIFYHYDLSNYQERNWKFYLSYNQYRTVQDNPNFQSSVFLSNTSNLIAVSDFLFKNIIFTEYSTLEQIKILFQKHRYPSIYQYINNWLYMFKRGGFFLIPFLLIFVFQIFHRRYIYLIPFFVFILLASYINLNTVFKGRVLHPMLIITTLMIGCTFANDFRTKYFNWVLILASIYVLYNNMKFYNPNFKYYNNRTSNNDTSILYVNLDLRIPTLHPFKFQKFTYNNSIMGGWLTNSPVQRKQLLRINTAQKEHVSLLDDSTIQSKCFYRLQTGSKIEKLINQYLILKNKKLSEAFIIGDNTYYKIINLQRFIK